MLFDDVVEHAVGMIIDKLTRLAVDPKRVDSWADIQGYAQYVMDELTSIKGGDNASLNDVLDNLDGCGSDDCQCKR